MTDAQPVVSIRIAKDAMTAELQVAHVSPLPSVADVRTNLAAKGVVFGVKEDRIAEALQNVGQWIVVAEGQPVRKPVAGRIEYHFDASNRPKIEIAADGRANLKELGILENVAAGHILATLVDPVPGAPGRNVRGEIVPPGMAAAAVLRAGKNVTLSADGKELTAAIDGRVVLDRDGTVSVENSLTIPGDVGPATGNVNFLGSVVVGGNVCSDFRVKSAYSILIAGHVEGAVIEAGGDITIRGGISGAGKAIIQTPGSLRAVHAQDCRIIVGGSLTVDHHLLRVEAVAGHSIEVVNGSIVGGSVTAPVIAAKGLGSEADVRTIVEFGIAPRAKLNAMRFENEFLAAREQYIRLKTKLAPLVAHHNAGKLFTADEKALMDRLEQECARLEAVLLACAGEVRHILQDPGVHVPGQVRVTGPVHMGVLLATSSNQRAVKQQLPNLNATASEGKMAGGAA